MARLPRRIFEGVAFRPCMRPQVFASIRAATTHRARICRQRPGLPLIAAVTTLDGIISGVHRTWLDPSGYGKAPIDTPRRAMGFLLGNAVRFGVADDVLAAGEGIETMLSLRCCVADLADGISALSQSPRSHVAAIRPPPALYCSRRSTPPERRRRWLWPNAQKPPASKRSHCRHVWVTSTRICTSSASMSFGQRYGFSWHPRTSPAFCSCRLRSYRRGRRPSTSIDSSVAAAQCRRGRDHGLLEGDRTAGGCGPATAAASYFPPRSAERMLTLYMGYMGRGALCIAKQNSRPPPSFAGAAALRAAPGAGPSRPPSSDRHEGRDGRGRSGKRTFIP